MLPVSEAGRYSLLVALLPVLGIIGGLGQQTLTTRFYSQQPQGAVHWPRDLVGTLAFSLPGIAICLAGAAWIYHLASGTIGFLAITVPLMILIQTTANVLASHRYYSWSSLLIRLPFSLMVIPATAALLLRCCADLEVMLAALIVAAALTLAVGIVLAAQRVPRGDVALTLRQRVSNIYLGIMASTHLLLDQGLMVIAGIISQNAPLAAFSALSTLVGPLYLAQGVVRQMVLVETARDDAFNYRRVALILWAAAALMIGGMVLLLPALSHLIYGGRYDAFNNLALPLALVGGLLITEILPRSMLVGRASDRWLNRFASVQVIVAAAGVVIGLAMGGANGMQGVAWAGVVIVVLRVLAAYGLFLAAWRNSSGHSLPSRI
jgi:hypothetical protein